MSILSPRESFAWIYYKIRTDKCMGNCSKPLVQSERSCLKQIHQGILWLLHSIDQGSEERFRLREIEAKH